MEGEEAAVGAVVVRTAWLYGPSGKCFPKSIVGAWQASKPLRVVDDQFGNPTYSADLAKVLGDLIEKDAAPGIYHAAGPNTMSWCEFARLAVEAYAEVFQCGHLPPVEPIATSAWPTAAKRPRYSALSFAKCAGLGIEPMRPAPAALREFWQRVRANLGPSA